MLQSVWLRSFIEPLEASALVLVELSASMIAEQLPQNRKVMDIVSKRFNEVLYRWDTIIDFSKVALCFIKKRGFRLLAG